MCRPYILGRKSELIHSSPRSGARGKSLGRKSRQTPAGLEIALPELLPVRSGMPTAKPVNHPPHTEVAEVAESRAGGSVLVVVGPPPQYRIELSQNLGERLVRILLGHGPNLRLDRGKRLLRVDEPLRAASPSVPPDAVGWPGASQPPGSHRFTRWLTAEQEERYRPRIEAARRLRELVSDLEGLEIRGVEHAEGRGT
jgi:hypothetical protein